jgi:hypothetical protein
MELDTGFIRDLTGYLAKPSECLSSNDLRDLQHLSGAFVAFSALEAEAFIRSRPLIPLVEILIQDGTPSRTVTQRTAHIGDVTVTRNAVQGKEFLCSRVFLYDGETYLMMMTPPKQMANKTCLTHFEGARQLFTGCRSYGHSGFLLSHSIWDRAVKTGCEKLRKQFLASWYLDEEHDVLTQSMLAWLMHWETYAGCSAHDWQNALRWSFMETMSSRASMRRVWVVCESLKNSIDQLIDGLKPWLAAHLREGDHVSHADLYEVYKRLGLTGVWLERFAALGLRFSDGFLYVSARVANEPDVLDAIAACFLHIWQFRTWSDGRWGGAPATCRRLTLGLYVGLDSMVNSILGDPKQSDYYIGGYRNLDDTVKPWVGVVSLSADVTLNPLELILKDDRIPLLLPELDELVANTRRDVLSISASVYAEVARVTGNTPRQLRHETIRSMTVQEGYAEYRLQDKRELPWTLVGGDVVQKLIDLRGQARPRNETAAKIHTLLNVGISPEVLETPVQMLGTLPHTTKIGEEAHVHVTRVLSKHPKLTTGVMQARATVAALKQLMTANPLVAKIAGVRRKIIKVRSRQPEKIHAKQAYMSALASAQRASPEGCTRIRMRLIVKKHGQLFAEKDEEYKDLMELLKLELREASRQEIKQKMAELVPILADLQTKLNKENALLKKSLRIASCRWSDRKVLDFQAFYQSDLWTDSHVRATQDETERILGPPDPYTTAFLQSMDVEMDARQCHRPEFLPWLCQWREFFSAAVLKLIRADGCSFVKFVYAQQNPLLVCLLVVQELDIPERHMAPADFRECEVDIFEHHFSIIWKYHYSDGGIFDGCIDLEILPDCMFIGEGFIVSHSQWTSMAVLQASLPASRSQPRAAKEEEPTEFVEEPWMKYAAMWDHVKTINEKSVQKSKKVHVHEDEDPESEDEADVEAPDLLSLHDRLMARRAELGDDAVEDWRAYYKWALRGGRWLAERTGLAYDCVAAQCLPDTAATDMALTFDNLNKMASFSISKFTEEGALALARLWIHRNYYFLILWLAKDCRAVPFTVDEVEGYVEPDNAAVLYTQGGDMATRIDTIRLIVPRL